MYEVLFSKRAIKDRELLKSAGLSEKARALCKILAENPFQNPPPYEKLVGDLKGSYSRRINVQHRLVYEVDEDKKAVYVLRMWSHYE
jgi:Txe/YoeB family toxin of toxin-antitoxin system